MIQPEAKILAAVDEFILFSAEKSRFRQALHQFHDAAAQLDQTLKTKAVDLIAGEQEDFKRQEKKMHDQANHFDQAIGHYQKALKGVRPHIKRSQQVFRAGIRYRVVRKGDAVEITVA